MVVKSLKRERLKENMEIFDWELSNEDLSKINQLPQHKTNRVTGILSPEGISSVDLADIDIIEM
jgi:diketogulonate reductase-like aldo/keto reductase